jgi:hypothetical protein
MAQHSRQPWPASVGRPARGHPVAARASANAVLALQESAGNRAVVRLLQRQERRPSWWMPSSPTLDISAAVMQQAFASSVRPLGQRERELAARVFGDSIDLDQVRIARSSVVATPTTLANTIRTSQEISDVTLIHELTHVWQFQTSGLRYVSCSLAGQAQGAIMHGDRNWAYDYKPRQERSRLSDYGPEQQAMIVEDAFRTGKLDEAPYAHLIAEIRSASPRRGGEAEAIDERALGPRRFEPMGSLSPDPRSEELGGTVPQLEWRF